MPIVTAKEVLFDAQASGGLLLINEINVGETYYILSRRSMESAEYFLDIILAGLPLKIVPNDFDHVIAAARIKARHPLCFADCFAVATAVSEGAAIMTGDPEFKEVEHLTKIEWLMEK